MFGNEIDKILQDHIGKILSEEKLPDLPENLVVTDNLTEVIEKMIILHIRTWMLEDKIGIAISDTEVADLKRKIDICFKVKRPQYIQAINRMIDDAIINKNTIKEDSVKSYDGYQ